MLSHEAGFNSHCGLKLTVAPAAKAGRPPQVARGGADQGANERNQRQAAPGRHAKVVQDNLVTALA